MLLFFFVLFFFVAEVLGAVDTLAVVGFAVEFDGELGWSLECAGW